MEAHLPPDACPLLHPKLVSRRWIQLRRRETWQRLPQQKGQVRLLMATSATVQLEEGGVLHMLEPRTVFHCHESYDLQVKVSSPRAARLLELTFDDDLACEYLHELQRQYGRPLRLPVSRTAQALNRVLASGRTPTSQEIFRWLALLHEFAHHHRTNLGIFLLGGPTGLQEVAERNHYSLKAIADELGCHQSHLSKCWRNRGYPPLAPLLRTQRLNTAKRLLSQSQMAIQAIANLCGYSGSSAFCTSFRTITGVSPGTWRRRHAPSETPARPPAPPKPSPAKEPPAPQAVIQDERPICVWGKPYFQFDGGEVSFPYEKPFNLAINTITSGISWVCTLQGHACFEVGGQCLEVGPGDVVITPKPMHGQWSTPHGTMWRRVWIHMRDPWSLRAIHSLTERYGWAFHISPDAQPVTIARRWIRRWNAGRSTPSVERSLAAYEWLLSWEALLQFQNPQPLPLPDLKLYQAPAYFRKIGTVSGYARSIGYSRAYLGRKLRRQWLGGTPSQIIRRHRLAQAAHELTNGNTSVDTIARRALYANTSAFIVAFKREYGTTPLAYRYHRSI